MLRLPGVPPGAWLCREARVMNIRGNELLHVGHSVPGVDSRAKLTGRAVYTTDLQIEGILHAKILRSTVPHARIRAIDVSGALAMPGIIAVVTGADLAQLDPCYGMYIRASTLLASSNGRVSARPPPPPRPLPTTRALSPPPPAPLPRP